MNFKRYGKSFQMVIRDGLDLEQAVNLDDALWGAVSAPANVFACDPKLTELLDTAKTGRITSSDMRNAIKWLLAQLPDHASITPTFDGKLPLTAITDATDAGRALRASAVYILNELAAPDKNVIDLAQIRTFLTTVTMRSLNGDGVLTLKAATSPEVTNIITDVVTATGGAKDLDGSMGLADKQLADFLAAVKLYTAWLDQGVIPEGESKTAIMSMGADTPALSALLNANAAKIDSFFALCRLLDFDARLLPRSLSPDAKVNAFDPANTADVEAYQASLPIATPGLDCLLPLDPGKINPAYRKWFTDITTKILRPILGDACNSINADEWAAVKATFAPYEAYLASRKGESVAKVPPERLRTYLDCQPLIDEVNRLMAVDKGVAETVRAAREVERLLLYRADLLRLANNFICFSELYSKRSHALFECGKLVIDGRWFSVSFKVDAIPAHLALAKASQLFLMYVEVQTGPGTKMNVVIPVTNGSKGNLVVGKRGIFYDMKGHECDAKIVQLLENPVCVREALMAPLSRLWNIVETKIVAWSGSAEKSLQGSFTKAITPAPAAAPPAAGAKPAVGGAGGFMGIGIACAAIGSSLAFISKTISGMSSFQIWMSVIVAILALMLPVSIIAIIKLNRQDLSSILEGCGWGINLRLRLDGKLRRQFTYYGKYPKDAKGTPKQHFLRSLCVFIVIVACVAGGTFLYHSCQAKKAAQKARVEAAEKAKAAEAEKAKAAEAAKPAAASPGATK